MPTKSHLVITKSTAAATVVFLDLLLCGLSIGWPSSKRVFHPTLQQAIESVVGHAPASQATSRPTTQPADLEIVAARYGASGAWIDVTEQVRRQVRHNALAIHAGNYIAGDPIFGVPKVLRVEYRLAGEGRVEQVAEGEVLRLPPQPETRPTWRSICTPEQLVALAKACPAEVGFCGKNLVTGQTVAYRADQPFCLASIVKLFVLTEVMHQVQQGELSVMDSISFGPSKPSKTQRVKEALDAMIGQSDNEATDALAARVGRRRVNALPETLGLTGLSDQVLPEPGVLESVLDQRIYGTRLLPKSNLPPQHGTARGMLGYFERLHERKLINPDVSRRVLEVLERNPKPFAPRATPIQCKSVGKGGNILWIHLFRRRYNMGGWAIYIYDAEGQTAITLCVLCEWFPARINNDEQFEWCSTLSNCIVNILLPSR